MTVTVLTCRDAETAAGAIALGEATNPEREAYRLHLSRCAHCVETLGGERDIERTMQHVAAARDAETWEPSVQPLRERRRKFAGFGWAFTAAAVALAAGSLLALPHARPSASTTPSVAVVTVPVVRAQQRHPIARVPAAPRRTVPAHNLIVVHNVVRLAEPPVPVRHAAPQALAVAPHSRHSRPPAAKAPSSSDERTVADTGTTNVPAQSQHAESLALLPSVVRDVAPVGGDNAIVPHPARIAYYENAEGTTAVDVAIDDRGTPVKCTVTKPSGFVVLDDSVCAAAMHVRYVPRAINGRPVGSVYHDAFTFHAGEEGQSPP
jgi:TonB family protein